MLDTSRPLYYLTPTPMTDPANPSSPNAFQSIMTEPSDLAKHHPIVPEPRWYAGGLVLMMLCVYLGVRLSRTPHHS